MGIAAEPHAGGVDLGAAKGEVMASGCVAIQVSVEARRERVEAFLHAIEPRVDPVEPGVDPGRKRIDPRPQVGRRPE